MLDTRKKKYKLTYVIKTDMHSNIFYGSIDDVKEKVMLLIDEGEAYCISFKELDKEEGKQKFSNEKV